MGCGEGEVLGEGLTLGEAVGDAVELAVGEADGDPLGVADGETVGEAVGVVDAEAEGLGDAVEVGDGLVLPPVTRTVPTALRASARSMYLTSPEAFASTTVTVHSSPGADKMQANSLSKAKAGSSLSIHVKPSLEAASKIS